MDAQHDIVLEALALEDIKERPQRCITNLYGHVLLVSLC